jgi:hypothetical protein
MITVVEPQCWGLEHASFNAAFLSTTAFSTNENILFYAEEEHLTAVKQILLKYDSKILCNVEFISIAIPKRNATGWFRLYSELPFLIKILDSTLKKGSKNLIFLSITNTGIFGLKMLLKKEHKFQVLVGLHGMLARIAGRLPLKPWNWFFSLQFLFYLKQPNQMLFLVFGQSIYQNVENINPKIINYFRYINLPNFEYDFSTNKSINHFDKIIFGYIGTGNLTKGIGLFAKIAQTMTKLSNSVEFLLVGYLSAWRSNTDYSSIKGISEVPLSTEEYIIRGLSMSYAINISSPNYYKFGGCSSFIDALFFGKPGIYLRNDYIEYYFNKMGNIGYLCDSYEEILELVMKISLNFPQKIYEEQIINIKKGRFLMTPKYISSDLKYILTETL